jgi:S-formylglutathione hydrolase FrmB
VLDHFSPARAPAAWAVIGYSEGGTCAIDLGLRHPERFGEYVDLAGGARPTAALGSGARQRRLTLTRLFGGSTRRMTEHDPARLLATAGASAPHGVLVVGSGDREAQNAAKGLAQTARRAQRRLPLVVLPGRHSYDFVSRAIAQELPRLADRLLRAALAPALVASGSPSGG